MYASAYLCNLQTPVLFSNKSVVSFFSLSNLFQDDYYCSMISYANAKVNIGLNIISKREDGYHNLETIFYPFSWYDILEITDAQEEVTSLEISGMDLRVEPDNLCLRAYRLLKEEFDIDPVHIHLHKQIPFGAGLGGGSSDAAVVLKMLNEKFGLSLSTSELEQRAACLGADCPFFIRNEPMYAEGIGTILSPISLALDAYKLVVVKPDVSISTQEAYRGVFPQVPEHSLLELIKLPVQEWKYYVQNDFETGIFEQYPLIHKLKLALYKEGAIYASMSGSGSAVFGIFDKDAKVTGLEDFGQVYYPVEL